MRFYKIYILAIILINLMFFACKKATVDTDVKELIGGFQLMKPEDTGIDFNNAIVETVYFNHYFFSQLYVGSGVAIGDLDNDGLPDIFFGGNQVGDRLYHNKGNFKFEDISKSSKITRSPGWSWGVTMADVNADGYLDIYVSRNGNSLEITKRRNMLFINNKDLTFTESAIAYGLADIGFSSQAVFFDMDNDGDLDMYQVNQPADNKVLLVNKILPKDYESFKDKIYRNTNNKFEDVSEEVGISQDLAYGLSVNASDFNNDGFIDLYVSNDYAAPDFMYFNNGDGTFRNVIKEKLKHFSHYSMGSDTGDINNDGFIDLVTTDMTPNDHYRSKMNMASMNTDTFQEMVKATDSYQYMSNTLQINTGIGMFSDIANLAGVANTDWSWSSLLVDIDNDGFKDLLVSNGIKKDIDNNDSKKEVSENSKDITYKELFTYSQNTPSNPVGNYAFKNNGDFKFTDVSEKWNFNTPSFSNGMAYADLDNDGDLDLVVNNIDAKAFVYKNKATANFLKIKLIGSEKNKFGIGARVKINHNKKQQTLENITTRGYFSSVESGLLFGVAKDKKIDKIEVYWNDEKVSYLENIDANQTLDIYYSEAEHKKNLISSKKQLFSKVDPISVGLNYKHQENEFDEFKEEVLLPHKLSNNGPFSAVADVNNDGFDDLFLGGSVGEEGVLYLQNEEGSFTISKIQPWRKDKESEDLGALFLDVDNDNDVDLYVTSGGSEYKQGYTLLKDRLYINDGLGNFIKDSKAIPDIFESTQTVKSSDIDKDGDLDLFIGVRLISGKYVYPASSYLLINEKGVFKKSAHSIAPDLENLGMVTDAVFSDIDKDGDEDLLVVGEWMPIKVFENQKGIFKDSSEKFGITTESRGFWWSIIANDLDNDGDDDYILGNLGKNNKFKASKEHPFKVFANDFDNNGTNDVVLAKFYKNSYVPVRGRECTSQQMPYVTDKFESYHSFASSTLLEILPEEKVKSAVIYEISTFESVILSNTKGKLMASPLPIQAQISPIKSSIVKDVNADGFKDIILVGNHYGVEVETVRYDAGFAAVLIGNGQNNFKYISPLESGFYVPKDSRNIKAIKIGNKESLLVTNNNDSLFLFNKN